MSILSVNLNINQVSRIYASTVYSTERYSPVRYNTMTEQFSEGSRAGGTPDQHCVIQTDILGPNRELKFWLVSQVTSLLKI